MNVVVVVVEVVEIVKASPVTSKLKGVDGDDDDDDVRGIIERNSRITSTIRTVKSRDRVHQHQRAFQVKECLPAELQLFLGQEDKGILVFGK